MGYKVILFDFFDVIAPDFYRIWLEKHGYTREGQFLAIAQAIDNGVIGLEEYYKRLSRMSKIPAESIREEFEAKTQINQAVIHLISQLRVHYKICLLTNSPQGLVRLILKKHHLEEYFDEIIISGEVGLMKPDPAIFELALKRVSASASEAIFIDNLQPYLDGAKRVGITGIRFENAVNLADDLRGIGVII